MSYTMFYIRSDMIGKIKSDYAFPDYTINAATGEPFEYSLYAITGSKKYAKIFRETRNMKYFVERQGEFSDVVQENFERDFGAFFIHKHPFRMIYQDGGKREVGQLILPVVNFEYDVVDLNGEYIFSDLIEGIDDNLSESTIEMANMFLSFGGCEIFKEPFRHILEKINFKYFYDDFHPMEEISYIPSNSTFNQLMLYAICYRGIYKKGGVQKLCEYGDFI